MLISARRAIAGAIGGGAAVGALLLGAAPSAIAAPPNCTAADLAGVASGVSAATSAYLFTHPDVNAFFSGLQGTPREDMKTKVNTFMDSNPQVRDELTGIRQPLRDIKNRCGDTDGDGVADVPAQ